MLHAARSKYRMQKPRHLCTIAQLCRAISSQLRHVSTIRKNLLNGNISSICVYNMVNFGPLMAEICWRVWAPQQISMGFASWIRYCSDVAQRTSTKIVRCLGISCICVLYMHFWGLPNGILPAAKFTLCPSIAFSSTGSVSTRHSSSGRQPNFVAWC